MFYIVWMCVVCHPDVLHLLCNLPGSVASLHCHSHICSHGLVKRPSSCDVCCFTNISCEFCTTLFKYCIFHYYVYSREVCIWDKLIYFNKSFWDRWLFRWECLYDCATLLLVLLEEVIMKLAYATEKCSLVSIPTNSTLMQTASR